MARGSAGTGSGLRARRIAFDLAYGVRRERTLRRLQVMRRSAGSFRAARMVSRASTASVFKPITALDCEKPGGRLAATLPALDKG